MSKMDLAFVVADTSQKELLKGFFLNPNYFLKARIRKLVFDVERCIFIAQGNDPGLYSNIHDLGRAIFNLSHKIVVIIDEEWEGSPGAAVIEDHILECLVSVGWQPEHIHVSVIQPELEQWFWMRNPNINQIVGFEDDSVETWLRSRGMWPLNSDKPTSPKMALKLVLAQSGIRWSSSIFNKVGGIMSLSRCSDDQFKKLLKQLRFWFPPLPIQT